MTTPTINGEKEKNSGNVLESCLTVVILIIDTYIYGHYKIIVSRWHDKKID